MIDIAGNAAAYFVDRHANGARRDHPAFREAGGAERTLTYGELGSASGRVGAMLERHGVGPEQRAILLMTDTVDLPVVFWGAIKAGVVPVPVNTMLSTELYATILADSRARALFVSAELLPVVAALLPGHPQLRAVFVVGGEAPEGTLDFARELAASESRATAPASPDECAFWLYSSGSTGQPKGVRHAHASLKYTADTFGAQILGIAPDDLVYSAAKLFFAYGLGNAMTFPMSVGATAVLYAGRPTPDAVFSVFDKFRPSVFCGVPTLYAALDAKLEAGAAKVEHPLRRCVSAGEALPEEVGAKWRRFTGCDILDGVGSTEMLHIFLSNRPGDVVYGTSGVAAPGYDLRLVDEQGAEVAEGAHRRIVGARRLGGDGLFWAPRAEPLDVRGALDAHRRQIRETCGRALPLLRPDRRHVQGQRHLGFAVRGRAGADWARQSTGGGCDAAAGCRRARKAQGLCRLEARRANRGASCGIARAREGAHRPLEISPMDRVPRGAAEDGDGENSAVQIEGISWGAASPKISGWTGCSSY